jgi:hypothetical protein
MAFTMNPVVVKTPVPMMFATISDVPVTTPNEAGRRPSPAVPAGMESIMIASYPGAVSQRAIG